MLATKRFFKLDLKIQTVFLRPSLSRDSSSRKRRSVFPITALRGRVPWLGQEDPHT